ncbi:MAG: YdcF family protein [Oceanipulchritudo sp.]
MDLFLNSLYSPFFYFYFGTVAAWAYLTLKVLSQCSRAHKRALGLFGLGLLLVGGFASSIGNQLLLGSLLTDHESIGPNSVNAAPPDFILVAASGYLIMEDSREDVLYDRTASRVATAANLHARYPDAVLIMQGTGYKQGPGGATVRPSGQQGALMKRLAISLGVPEDKIRIEDQSRNSREHVEALAALPGISRDSRLVVVSSDWHIRRLRMVFQPVFPNTVYCPSETPGQFRWSLSAFWPNEGSLARSRTYLREWAGILYYVLTD